jgi:hypothetical protein
VPVDEGAGSAAAGGGRHSGLPTEQSPEEVAAQVADGGPVATLEAWLLGVRELRQWPTPLGLMTDELRLACAQDYLLHLEHAGDASNRSAAQALANAQHPECPAFCEWLQGAIDVLFDGWPGLVAVGSRPRPVDLDHELVLLVLLVPYDNVNAPTTTVPGVGEVKVVRDPDPSSVHLGFLMRRTDEAPAGWLVAGWNGEQRPQPGWPPRF